VVTIMKDKKKRRKDMAGQADRHRLYELSVQCAEAEVDFVEQTFKTLRGRKAYQLREDFCGTANVCCEWVGRGSRYSAVGVDLDPEVLAWGREHRVEALSDKQRARVALIQDNVLTAQTQPVDVLLAMNFSYWLFKERAQLLDYFRTARNNLVDDGIFFLDAYGGYDSFREVEEEREIDDDADGFTYFWDQASFNPIDNHLICHIHFAFPDGSLMENAFTYDWRLYTLPEIRDLLHEAGFSKTTVYWQGWDENGEASGEFYPADNADADAGWICYLVAEK
jgi:SAM-dependent methyltransferase